MFCSTWAYLSLPSIYDIKLKLIYDRHTTTHPINICKNKERILCVDFSHHWLTLHFIRMILHTSAYILQDLKFNPNAYRIKKEQVFLCHAHISHNDY